MEKIMLTTENRIQQYKEFMGNYADNVILQQLMHIGFFEAPASTKYHGNYPGGLFDHSLVVATELVGLTKCLNLEWQRKRSPYIVGMYHDICKCDSYEKEVDGYIYNPNNAFPGHGAKSVLILSPICRMTEEEVYCIRYHMGAYEKEEWDYYDRAIRKYPNVLWTHTADMSASKIHNV